ncbi:MAG: hypothetical protein IPK83_00400 [Planctomycetes bacterium]|nr:hypothetical protein [Planctomycetota bacterium]
MHFFAVMHPIGIREIDIARYRRVALVGFAVSVFSGCANSVSSREIVREQYVREYKQYQSASSLEWLSKTFLKHGLEKNEIIATLGEMEEYNWGNDETIPA